MKPAIRFFSAGLVVPGVENITILFAPWCIVHLGDDEFQFCVILIETVVETDRVEPEAKIAKVCQ